MIHSLSQIQISFIAAACSWTVETQAAVEELRLAAA
jgi:hypothetical protein